MTNWSWASLRLLGTAGVNNVPPARLCAGTGLQRVSPYNWTVGNKKGEGLHLWGWECA